MAWLPMLFLFLHVEDGIVVMGQIAYTADIYIRKKVRRPLFYDWRRFMAVTNLQGLDNAIGDGQSRSVNLISSF